jgi:hypothetical protein
MKRSFVVGLCLLLFGIGGVNAQTPSWQWATIGNNNGKAYGTSTCFDNDGNIYVLGTYLNTIIVDSFSLQSAGGYDIILLKYNANGQLRWAKRMGGPGDDGFEGGVGSVATGDDGSVYLGCIFSDSMVVDNQQFVSNGEKDVALMKLDTNGHLVWGKSFGTVYNEFVSRILVKRNRLYLIGLFSDAGTATLQIDNISLTTHGGWDVFFFKADTSGHIIWAKDEGTPRSEGPGDIAVDKNDNVFISGDVGCTIYFENDYLSDPSVDGVNFIAKYDSTGNELWSRGGYSNYGYYGSLLEVDTNGCVYTTGFNIEQQTVTWGSSTVWNIYNYAYLVKYNPNGVLVFAKNVASYTNYDAYCCIRVNPQDNMVYLSGEFNSNGVFGNDTILSYGNDDIIVLKFNENGVLQKTIHAGGFGNESAYGMAISNTGDIAVTGYTSSAPCNFGNNQVSSSSGWDIYVAKLSPTTGINDVPPIASIAVYPNPADDILTIEANQNGRFEMVDLMGRILLQSQIINHQSQIDMKDYPSGIYFIKYQNDKETETIKVIKQ